MADTLRVPFGGRTYQVRIAMDDTVTIDLMSYDCKQVVKTWKGSTDCSGLIHGKNLPPLDVLEHLEYAFGERC